MRGGLDAFLKAFLIIVICLLLGFVSAGVDIKGSARAQTKKAGDVTSLVDFDIITLNYKNYEKDRKAPVQFTHRKHAGEYKIFCWECHHDYKDGKNIYSAWGKTQKCNECHDPLEKQGKAMKLQTSFHLSCSNCHVERAIYEKEPRAYRKCGKCHIEVVMIENEGYKKDKSGPVKFQHRKHEIKYLNLEDKNIPCTECHHEYKDGKNIWKEGDPVKKCGAEDCHDPLKKKDKKNHKLQIAYHKNCKACHKAIVKAGKKKPKQAPYRKCSLCMGKNWRS
jgi:hypothetical protein